MTIDKVVTGKPSYPRMYFNSY